MSLKENKYIKSILFLASPFLCLPGMLAGIYQKSKFSLSLFVVLFGLLSYMYIPHIANDKARYIEFYYLFKNYPDFNHFLIYIFDGRPDFLLHFLFFVFAKFNIPAQFLFLLITSFTVWVWFWILNKITIDSNLKNTHYFLFFIAVLFSFSLPHLLSGTRFYFGAAFIMLAYYKGLIEGKNKIAILFLVAAVSIHWSSLIFIAAYFVLKFFSSKDNLFKVLFVCSFIFMFTPKSFIIQLLGFFDFSAEYAKKIDLYLLEEDFVQQAISEGSAGQFWLYLFSTMWVYFAYAYLLFTLNRKSVLRNIVYLLFAVVNIFYVVPLVYTRYLVVLAFLFVLLMVTEFIQSKKLIALYTLIGLLSVRFVSNIAVMRDNIVESYFHSESFFLITIFLKDYITLKDFLY